MDLPTGPGAQEEKTREDSSLEAARDRRRRKKQFLLRYEMTEQQMRVCCKHAGYF